MGSEMCIRDRKEKGARGVQYAEDMWSWKHWAVEFVEAAKEC